MNGQTHNRKLAQLALTCVMALALSGAVAAQPPPGRGVGGGHAPGGYRGYGGYPGGHYGYRGGHYGYPGGYRGYGGYYYGYPGGYWGYPGGYGWGWGGPGLGLYFTTLPPYYSTLWLGGVHYYYSDNTYYRWNGAVGRYETVAPPPEVQDQVAESSASSDLFAYPRKSQTAEQQAKDKQECHRWAVDQAGYDPTQRAQAAPNVYADYMRAQAACLEGREYSVR